jgi:hypothetical protein
MQTDSPVAEAVRKPRRVVAKSTGRQAAKPVKTAVSLSPETMRRLVIFAAMTDRTQSQVVAELIDLHCRRFVVQDRDRSANLADQATHEVSAAA